MSSTVREYGSRSSDHPESPQHSIVIGKKRRLDLIQVHAFVKNKSRVELSPESFPALQESYAFLKECVAERFPIYGLNTNFGDQVSLIDPYLNHPNTELYYTSIYNRQRNIIKSLSCGLGDPVPLEVVRVTMLLRAHCLSQGYSGVSITAIETIINHINAGITALVPTYGSIGASGDLIPLSTIAAAYLGENIPVHYKNKIMPAAEALPLAGLSPFKPELRDGLAMINGTSFMTAIASLTLYKLKILFHQLLAAVGLALESMLVIGSAYHPLVHRLKGHQGEQRVNEYLLHFWEGSQLISNLDELRKTDFAASVDTGPRRSVQDYYSLRSVSQGFGPFLENIENAVRWVEDEMNSVNDNPVIDLEEKAIHHGANFMGYYVTAACDQLKMDIAQASTWIHALLANLVNPRKNQHLPTNIVENPAQHNGFRSMQLLAAAITVQNRKLAQSQQAFMLPTEGDNQDVNSLGTHAALDLQESVNNLERLTAILMLAAVQALEFRELNKASLKSKALHRAVRNHSPTLRECRPMSAEIETIIKLLREEKLC